MTSAQESRLPAFQADRLRAFLAVAQEGGFSRAARALGRTQSSLSQAVRALEEELGEVLFVRDAREVQLTEAGVLLREHAERAFDELARARDALLALRKLTRGRLRVGTSDTLATHVLPFVFATFRDRFPEVELGLDNRPSLAIAERVARRELDLGLVSLPFPAGLRVLGRAVEDTLRCEVLGPQRDVLICPPRHWIARRRSLKLSELGAEAWVLLDRSTVGRALLDAAFAAHGVRPRVVMETSSVEVIKRLVELNFGISVVPAFCVRRERAQGVLRALPSRDLPMRQVGLITPTLGPLSHAARAFVDVLRRELPKALK